MQYSCILPLIRGYHRDLWGSVCTLYVHTVHYSLYIIDYTLYILYYTCYTLYFIHVVSYTLYIIHYKLQVTVRLITVPVDRYFISKNRFHGQNCHHKNIDNMSILQCILANVNKIIVITMCHCIYGTITRRRKKV